MKIKFKNFTLIQLLIVLALTSACVNTNVNEKTVLKLDAVVTAKWLMEHLSDPDLVVIDSTVIVSVDDKGQFSSVSGRANYDEGHIPTAGFADLKGNLSSQANSLEFGMPSQEQFSRVMGELGVGSDSRVVIYSADNSSWAARVWWMLRWAGFDQVALLDGGLQAWTEAGGTLSTEASNRAVKQFIFKLREGVVANHDEVFSAISDEQVTIADALPEAHYLGQFSLYSRPGHIKSAVSMPSSNYTDSEYYKPVDELDLLFDEERSERIITYCGGGVAASSLAFSMVRAGYSDVAVYMGSLEEWTVNPENPMTK